MNVDMKILIHIYKKAFDNLFKGGSVSSFPESRLPLVTS